MSKLRSLRVLGVRVNQRGDWLFVRLETDAGHTGYGELSHSGDDRAVAKLRTERIAPFLVGRALDAVRTLTGALERELGSSNSSLRVRRTALSGTEHALWDVFARQLGVPVHALFGGALCSRVPLYYARA